MQTPDKQPKAAGESRDGEPDAETASMSSTTAVDIVHISGGVRRRSPQKSPERTASTTPPASPSSLNAKLSRSGSGGYGNSRGAIARMVKAVRPYLGTLTQLATILAVIGIVIVAQRPAGGDADDDISADNPLLRSSSSSSSAAARRRVVALRDGPGHGRAVDIRGRTGLANLIGAIKGRRKALKLDADYSDIMLSGGRDKRSEKRKTMPEDKNRWTQDNEIRRKNNAKREELDKECVLHPWQETQYPACNVLHEIVSSPVEIEYEASGSQSVVFTFLDLFADNDNSADDEGKQDWSLKQKQEQRQWGQGQYMVFKTQRYSGKYVEGYTATSYDRRRREAMVLERLTSSPYVASTHNFCAMGSVSPFASQGSLFELVNSVRNGGKDVSSLDKLRIGVQLSGGLAALHGIDGPDNPSFAHNDLDISQHVYQDGKFQINDFGYGKMLGYYPDRDNKPCKGTSYPLEGWKYRAPEDLESYFDSGKGIRLDVADVFSLGTELYMLLTHKWMWEGESRKKSCRRLIDGERPKLPKKVRKSNDFAIKALVKALEMCWEHDPKERATAGEVAKYLEEELGRLDAGWVKGTEVRVELPRLVSGHSDYDENM